MTPRFQAQFDGTIFPLFGRTVAGHGIIQTVYFEGQDDFIPLIRLSPQNVRVIASNARVSLDRIVQDHKRR